MDNKKTIVLGISVLFFCAGVLIFSGSFKLNKGGRRAANELGDGLQANERVLVEEQDRGSSILNTVFLAGSAGLSVLSFFLLMKNLRSAAPKGTHNPLTIPTLAFAVLFIFFICCISVGGLRDIVIMMIVDESGICQLILLIMVVGVCLSFGHFVFLNREFSTLLEIQEHCRQLDQNGTDYAHKVARVMENQAKGILQQKWQNMERVLAHVEDVDFPTVMSFTDLQESLKESKLQFIIKLLPVLGLIGTVLGFVIAVVGMQQAAANMVDFSSFKGNMLNALGGMRYAFLTTLAGMAGMVLVMFINSLVAEARKRILLSEDEFLYLCLFIPVLSKTRKTDDETPL